MFDIHFDFVTGMGLLLEFPPSREIHEDMAFAMDLVIGMFRITVVKWDKEE